MGGYRRIKGLPLSIVLAGAWLSLVVFCMCHDVIAAPTAPLGQHCRDTSPAAEDWCGCTWGEVLFQGRPVPGAMVTLTFENSAVSDTTRMTELERIPYFALTGQRLGAHRGDVLTLTAHFAGQRVERVIRAWPEGDEQHVMLALPERGAWSPWLTDGYTRTLVLAGGTVWAGGPAGVISVSLDSGVSVAHTLPWPNQSVRALAVGTDGHVWAAGAGGVAEFDGHTWHTHTVPLSHTLLALAVHATADTVWLGGGDGNAGSVAVYDGTWQVAGTFRGSVTALAVDDDGWVWAAISGDGVYRQNGGGGWTHYRVQNGLASDDVRAIVAGRGDVWFGTGPCLLSGQGPRGGIARYDLTTGTWRVYTVAHGLPPADKIPGAPAAAYALARGEDGTMWAGTEQGVSFLADVAWWGIYTAPYGLRPGAVKAIVAGSGTVVAAPPAGLDILGWNAVTGSLPTVVTMTVTPATLTLGVDVRLSGGGADADEEGRQVVAWDWWSNLDGALCTTMTCRLSYGLFTPGLHTVALRVQDDEGAWSVPEERVLIVEAARRVYLPLVVRGD